MIHAYEKVNLLCVCLLLVFSAGGCSRNPKKPTGEDIHVTAQGWIERGATVQLQAELRGTVIPDSMLTWTASPSEAVQFDTLGQAVLKTTGPVDIHVTYGTHQGGLRLDVSTPPLIAFDMKVDGNRDIYISALDGQDLLRLTLDPAEDVDPNVAHNIVAFTSFRFGNGEICTVVPGGGNVQRITYTTANETAPALSPSGERIAYISDSGGVPKLWWLKLDTRVEQRLTLNFGFEGSPENSPTWSPDGQRLAFVASIYGESDLFEYVVADQSIQLLQTSDYADVEPAWSPDGQTLVFASSRHGDTDLYLLDTSNGLVTRLTDHPGIDAQPVWLPDGRLLYTEWEGESTTLRWLDISDIDSAWVVFLPSSDVGHPAIVPD